MHLHPPGVAALSEGLAERRPPRACTRATFQSLSIIDRDSNPSIYMIRSLLNRVHLSIHMVACYLSIYTMYLYEPIYPYDCYQSSLYTNLSTHTIAIHPLHTMAGVGAERGPGGAAVRRPAGGPAGGRPPHLPRDRSIITMARLKDRQAGWWPCRRPPRPAAPPCASSGPSPWRCGPPYPGTPTKFTPSAPVPRARRPLAACAPSPCRHAALPRVRLACGR